MHVIDHIYLYNFYLLFMQLTDSNQLLPVTFLSTLSLALIPCFKKLSQSLLGNFGNYGH